MHSKRGSLGLPSVTALLGLAMLALGCSGEDTRSEGAVISELRSAVPRAAPEASEAARASQSEQAFAASLLQALDADQNLAFSPHSLSTAFAMLTDAAEGETLAEIEQALAFGKADEAFHRSQDALQLGLDARNRDAMKTDELTVDAQTLSASNDIWLREDVPPTSAYLDTLARFYGAGVHIADFPSQPEQSRVAINAKVSNDTRALISELLPEKSITTDTVAVLTNALYFKAPWAEPFREAAPGTFQNLDGSRGDVKMLSTREQLRYFAGDGFAAVALPYYGGELELQLIVPDAGAYESVRSALSSDLLAQIATDSRVEDVDLTLPKFEVKSSVPAANALQALGVVTAFDENLASFPAFASPAYDNVYVTDVLHQATVAIDEKGTEASAATAVVLTGILLGGVDVEMPPPKVVVADHPFLFVIRDRPTGSTLFVGQIVAP
jgi:serpin B